MLQEAVKNIGDHVRFWRMHLKVKEGKMVDGYFTKMESG